ncbi:unnamed protein product [Withania somnifera]
MGQNNGLTGGKGRKEEVKKEEEVEEGDEQDGMSVHSPCKPVSSALHKEAEEVELEIRFLEALEIYPPFNRQFSPDDILKLLDRFYNLDMVKPDDEDIEILNQEEEFCLPHSYFSKEEP